MYIIIICLISFVFLLTIGGFIMKVRDLAKKNEEVKSVVCERIEEDKLRKANKVVRLKKLCAMGKRIGFVVYTPGTESGRPFHAVQMVCAEVNKTAEGNYIIKGVDVELSLTQDAKNEAKISKRAVIAEKFDSKCFRSYRIDRILDGTITWQ